MRILFLIYHGFSEISGISKKIHAQVKGLRANGHDVRLCYYGFDENNHCCRFMDNQVIKDYGKGKWAGLRQRMDYGCILDYCLRESIELVYARCFMNATPCLIHFFQKLKKAKIRAVTEIPTYPYDGEFLGASMKDQINLIVDKLFRKRLYYNMDALVTFSDAKMIFGNRTIEIIYGIDFDDIPLHHFCPSSSQSSSLHLIGVAEVHFWHGYDRLISGLGEYYKNGGDRDVFFHIVGGVHPDYMKDIPQAPGFSVRMKKYGIEDKVLFHGPLYGTQLDEIFNQCQFAIGSLGRHRSGITAIKTLKNREYASRGIPFVYSEQDSDFDNCPYVIKAPADETPINVQQIIDFMSHFSMTASEIRKSVESLSWKIQMQRVVNELKLICN